MGGSRLGRVLLAGDVGGTKTTLALYASADMRHPHVERTFASQSAATLDDLIDEFLRGAPRPDAACLAVAGPVVDDVVRVTNLPWVVSADAVRSQHKLARVSLLNDVEALGWAATALGSTELETLQEGRPHQAGPLALLALGTGLGEAYVTGGPEAWSVHASEGGHADFAPATETQARLLATLRREFGHVSVERACSGSGLPRVYRFWVNDSQAEEDPALAHDLAQTADPTPLIIRAALEGTSPVCRDAVALFCDLVAAEAANLALKILPAGGVYLGGGLAPRLLPFLRAARFREAFLAKGRMAPLVADLPVRVILPTEAVLWGAAVRGMSFGPEPRAGRSRRGERRTP